MRRHGVDRATEARRRANFRPIQARRGAMPYSRRPMALRLGTGLIEARGATKAAKLETALDKVLVELGWERTYEGKEPPSPDPADGATPFTIMANDDGMLAIQVGEEP